MTETFSKQKPDRWKNSRERQFTFSEKKNALDMADKSNFDIQKNIITLYTGLNS